MRRLELAMVATMALSLGLLAGCGKSEDAARDAASPQVQASGAKGNAARAPEPELNPNYRGAPGGGVGSRVGGN
ncbi:MAG: hypothetical protein IT208_14085 [Chthonomonadales bacterium]|nr:hypothetical protein [Chthonomonadales bacterium]